VDVIDMGRGIDDRDIPHVFDAFYQADTSLSAGEGSGMGLAISRKYAAMMGGELSVTSTPGEGSVFHLSIPVRTPASPSEPQLEFRDVCGLAPGQPRYRVLVTAKDQADRTLMTALLVRVGFDVRDARNGEEAVAMALHWRPDFIWLDLGASLEDGFAVAGRIKAMREGEGIKIAALTASAAAIGAEDAIAVGCDAFARKPIRPESVFRVMHEQLGVNYSYGKLQEANHHEKDNTTQQDVTRLPDKLTMSLLACAEQLDQTGMLQLIEQVEQHSAALAYSLRTLARSFRFDDIKELLADGQGHSA
jgi:CheY-like chemotaxis protein